MMNDYLSKLFNGSSSQFFTFLDERMVLKKKSFVITANPEILMMAESNPDIHEMLLSDEILIVPDGISVVKAMNSNGFKAQERVTGISICKYMLGSAGEKGLSVYLLGSAEEVVKTLTEKMKEKYPKASFNYSNGYDRDKDEVFSEIKELAPDLIIVGLGVPAQERLINKHYADFSKGIFVGVGGSMDVLSGMKKPAPKFFIKTNTEWLYRIVREPKRLKRFWNNNIKFMKYMKKTDK